MQAYHFWIIHPTILLSNLAGPEYIVVECVDNAEALRHKDTLEKSGKTVLGIYLAGGAVTETSGEPRDAQARGLEIRLQEAEAIITEAAERERRHSTAGTAPAEYLAKYYGAGRNQSGISEDFIEHIEEKENANEKN